ncbi:titin [Elysia marginata]|uniref:Titin n=1 Tax=Elysia marginata TaxID=1093978 RepID=A0AAV4EIR3_9GAST|nr:titin [Elysia marginata]
MIFDICNSSSPFGKGLKSPLTQNNIRKKEEKIQDAVNYILQLQEVCGKPLVTGRRKTGFVGFLCTINSILQLAKRLFANFNFNYLMTYRLSQDHLETFFSCIRRRNGWNNNPTPAQFKWSLRSLLLSSRANCVHVEEPSNSLIDQDADSPFKEQDKALANFSKYEDPTREGWRSLVSGIPTTRYRVPDISPTENYRFRVRALSPYGVSPPSYPTGLYRQISPMRPLAQDLHLSDVQPDSLRLSWRSASVPPSTSTTTVPSYQIEAMQYPERQWRPLATGIRDTSYQLRGLKPSSDYSFRVRAQTPSGLAEPTPPITLTSLPVRPRLPTREPIISDLGLDSVRLTWKPAELPYYSRHATPITYTIDYQEIPSREWIVAGRSIPETSYTIRGLNPERDYRFRVTPETEFGPGEASLPVLARRHVAPVFPRREPLLSNITPTSATLSWSPATFPDVSSLSSRNITYRVEAREPPSSLWAPLSGGRGLLGTTYDLQFLHPDQDYMFRVVAEHGEFESEPSMTAYLPHRAGPPKMPRDAPQVSSVQPESLFLSWRSVELPSRITDYSPVTYRVEIQEGPHGHWSPLARQINQTHYRVTGLKPDLSYNFRVRAENAFGISDPTDPVLVRKRAVAPTLSEHEPLISDVRADSLRLTWKPAELPSYLTDSVPVTYTILMQEPGDHSWGPIARRVSGTSYYVTGLRPDKDYSFRVQAENNYGTSLPSFPSRLLREVKGPIYSPEIEDVEPSSFRLSWRSPSVSRSTTYAVETLEPSTWKWRPMVSRLPHPSFKVTDVTPGRDYAFRVRAEVDSVITEPSLPISFSNRRAKLTLVYTVSSWSEQVRELPDTYWRTLIPNTDAWSYEVTSLRPDQDYAFRVRTVTDTGMSEPSLPVYLYRKAATPKVPLPSPEISDVGDNFIGLRWNKVDIPAFDVDETPLSFMIEAQSVPDYNWKPVARGVTGASYKITGLEPKRDYQFRLRGETALGLTQPSTPVPAFRTPLRSGVPIVNVKIDRDSNLPYSARLRWNPVYIPPYSPTRGQPTYAIENHRGLTCRPCQGQPWITPR